MEHTKGKIEVSSSNSESIYVLKDGRADGLFATCDAGDYARSQEEGFANAKELVRRWNAFEEDGLVNDLLAKIESVLKAEFPLLLGLAKLQSKAEVEMVEERIEEMKAAIAKAKQS